MRVIYLIMVTAIIIVVSVFCYLHITNVVNIAYSDGLRDGYYRGYYNGQDTMFGEGYTRDRLYEGYMGKEWCDQDGCFPRPKVIPYFPEGEILPYGMHDIYKMWVV
jgi:hypothetical protein